MEHLAIEPERQHFLNKLVREVVRAELTVIEHAAREARRIGDEAPPTIALRAAAAHGAAMLPRFTSLLSGYDIPIRRGGLGAALSMLRDLNVDRIVQGQRANRIALLDLRHGVDLVKLLREIARGDQLLGVIRWCDDWLGSRRTLVAHAERQLAWFSEAPALADASAHTEREPEIAEIRADPDGRPSSHDHL